MEMTDNGGLPTLHDETPSTNRTQLERTLQQRAQSELTHPTLTGTVGSENVVFTEYTGMGLLGLVVSQLTSTTTPKRRDLPAAAIVSSVRNEGMREVR